MVKDCRWGYRWSSLVKTGQPSGWQQLTHMANIPLFFATSSCKELIGIGITFGSFPPDWLFFATQTQQWVYIGDQEVNMDFHSFRPPFADDLACQAQPDGLTLALPIWPAPWLPPLPAGSLELVERSDAPPEDAWRLPGPP